jgi:hypothetical protein
MCLTWHIQITPSHSHCSIPNNFSTSLGLGEQGLGWVSVMPDAIASVDVDVNGTRLRFDGYGSHDKVPTSRIYPTLPYTLHYIYSIPSRPSLI